ncbi:MAG TPA: hypothetical protein VM716_09675 [Gemmatimonadales bacterium]|nr:hypothetical protein [Gemmatimonadales bacterium]
MTATHRELAALLFRAETAAGEIARRLAAEGDWQYADAVALRAHVADSVRRLSEYVCPERIEPFAWRMTYQATLCSRELTALEPLLARAAELAWAIRAQAPAPRLGPWPFSGLLSVLAG